MLHSTARLALLLALSACDASATRAQDGAGADTGSFRSDTTSLRYTMDRPPGRGPFPVIVLVHGSGRTTRDEMLNIVPRFTERGFAVFRYDKRGVGESGGVFRGVNAATSITVIPELARDAAAALATACAAPDIDATRCGYFGASQAGWIIPEAVRIQGHAAFAILFSGVTVPVGVQMRFANVTSVTGTALDSAYAAIEHFTGDAGYDPASTLAQFRAPSLWLLGLEDRLLPNRSAIGQLQALRASGLPVSAIAFPTYGHALGPDIWRDIDAFLSPFRSR